MVSTGWLLSNTPVGNLHLHVDGTTATQPGDWVTLMFEVNAISGKNNDIGMPMYLVARNNAEGKVPSASAEQIITLSEIPGFSLKIPAGSATFPPDLDDHTITVTAVHADKIPMPPGEGMQPRFIVSIGPPQVKFDPPAPITFPNVNGLKPGEQTHFYSFDHDLGTYVSIGTGTVSEDGATMTSDKGFGIVKGGWHCGGPGNPTGTCSACRVDVTAEDHIVGMGDVVRFHAATYPEYGFLSWSLPAGNAEHDRAIDVKCTVPGTFWNEGSWQCNDGGSTTKKAFGMCVGVASISTTCNWFELGTELKKDDFVIHTLPDGFASKSFVQFEESKVTGNDFTEGVGTGLVSIKSGTSNVSTSINVIDPYVSKGVAALGWNKAAYEDFIQGIAKVANAVGKPKCIPNIKWEAFGKKTKTVCNCEVQDAISVGGFISAEMDACEIETPEITTNVPGLTVVVGGGFGLKVKGTGSLDIHQTCSEPGVCLTIDGSGSMYVYGKACLGTCKLIEAKVESGAGLTITAGKICTNGDYKLFKVGAPVLTLKGSAKLAGLRVVEYTGTWDVSGLF